MQSSILSCKNNKQSTWRTPCYSRVCGYYYLKHTSPTHHAKGWKASYPVCRWAEELQRYFGWRECSACAYAHTHTHRFTLHLASSKCLQLVQIVLNGVKGAAYKLIPVSAESNGQGGLQDILHSQAEVNRWGIYYQQHGSFDHVQFYHFCKEQNKWN